MNLARGSLAAALLMTSNCSQAASIADARTYHGVPLASNVRCSSDDCRSYNVYPAVRARTAVSVRCMGDTPPGQTPNPEPAPPNYLVSDIGKRGVPQLDMRENSLVARIRRYVRSKTLRFAIVDNFPTGGEFIVFDAIDGPCTVGALGYAVLNGSCNEYYKPGENPYTTFPAPDGCYRAARRPWMN